MQEFFIVVITAFFIRILKIKIEIQIIYFKGNLIVINIIVNEKKQISKTKI